MLNWYYSFYNEENNTQITGAVSTPAIPGITFLIVREQLIRPYLEKQGILNPRGLAYERAKNAVVQTPIVDASEIASYIQIGGEKYSTQTGYSENTPKEYCVESNANNINADYVRINLIENQQNMPLEDLFESWKNAHKCDSEYAMNSNPQIEKDSFVEDGPINKDIYEKSNIKVLFVLKEANVTFDKKVGVSGKYTVSRSIVEWVNDVIENSGQHELLKTIDGMNKVIHKAVLNEDDASLKQIAYMNLNKRGGAGKATDSKVLKAYALKYSDYIKHEIEILRPDYVICCGNGTMQMISEIILKNAWISDCFKNGNVLYIKARHPSYSYMTTQQKTDEFEKHFKDAYANQLTLF